MIRQPPRSTQSRSSAASDVYERQVRQDPRMSDLFIALNTSLSGSFNDAMVKKVGCNRFISKFQPDLLVDVVQQRMREILDADS